MARNSLTVDIKINDTEVSVDLDDTVVEQIERELGADVQPTMKLEVTDAGDLDEEVAKHLKDVKALMALGEVIEEAHDADAGQAAFIVAQDYHHDPDGDDCKSTLENMSWSGSVGEDEKDYAQYVLDEGLMDKKALDGYLDHEAIGRDYLMDMPTSELKDGRIIAWNE